MAGTSQSEQVLQLMSEYLERPPKVLTLEEAHSFISQFAATNLIPRLKNFALHFRDQSGKTLLHYAATYILKPGKGILEVLIQLGLSVDQQDLMGNTPLHYAVIMSNQPAAEVLLEWDADTAVCNYLGCSVLRLAAQSRVHSFIEFFASRNDIVQSDLDGKDLVHHATLSQNLIAIYALLEPPCSRTDLLKDIHLETAVHAAVRTGSFEVVQAFMRDTIDLNAQNILGQTALHILFTLPELSSEFRHLILGMFMATGTVDITIQDAYGDTVLHYASRIGDDAMVSYLGTLVPGLLKISNALSLTAPHLAATTETFMVFVNHLHVGPKDLLLFNLSGADLLSSFGQRYLEILLYYVAQLPIPSTLISTMHSHPDWLVQQNREQYNNTVLGAFFAKASEADILHLLQYYLKTPVFVTQCQHNLTYLQILAFRGFVKAYEYAFKLQFPNSWKTFDMQRRFNSERNSAGQMIFQLPPLVIQQSLTYLPNLDELLNKRGFVNKLLHTPVLLTSVLSESVSCCEILWKKADQAFIQSLTLQQALILIAKIASPILQPVEKANLFMAHLRQMLNGSNVIEAARLCLSPELTSLFAAKLVLNEPLQFINIESGGIQVALDTLQSVAALKPNLDIKLLVLSLACKLYLKRQDISRFKYHLNHLSLALENIKEQGVLSATFLEVLGSTVQNLKQHRSNVPSAAELIDMPRSLTVARDTHNGASSNGSLAPDLESRVTGKKRSAEGGDQSGHAKKLRRI